jgi:predicted DNA-binding transcriptional regulator AlpA
MSFITADVVASLTGFEDGPAFLRARERLERYESFPPPMPTCLRPLKWRKDAVLAWLDTAGTPEARLRAATGPNIVLLEEARRA